MKELYRSPDSRCIVAVGDITSLACNAIVNAANSGLLGGGGVDGAIHRAGGPAILAECRALRNGPLPDGLPPGKAVATTAGRLPAKRVIHTVGPIWHGGFHGEDETLASCYRECLTLAAREHLDSIAFPAISTGVYCFPKERAAHIAWRTVLEFLEARNQLVGLTSSGAAQAMGAAPAATERPSIDIRPAPCPYTIWFVFFSEDDGHLFLRTNGLA